MQGKNRLLPIVSNKIGVLHQKLLDKFLNRSRTVVHNSIEMHRILIVSTIKYISS